MKSLYAAARTTNGRLDFYGKTPELVARAAKVSGIHMPTYGFSGKTFNEAESFSTKEKLYQFMKSRPETERVFPYLVIQSVVV